MEKNTRRPPLVEKSMSASRTPYWHLLRKDSEFLLPWSGTRQGHGGVAKALVEPPATRRLPTQPLQSAAENFPVRAPLSLSTSDSLALILETRDCLYLEEFITPWGKRQ